jgi:hypothetical protein
MKKQLLTLGIVFFLISCGDNSPYPVLIENSSTKNVSYNYQDYSGTLAPGKSISYMVDKETSGPALSLVPAGQPRSVKAERKNDGWHFVPAEPITLSVKNTLSFSVKITAADYYDHKNKDYIDTGKPSPNSTELVVPKSDDPPISETIYIYTRKPIFFVSGGNVNVYWKIEKDTMNVTIR